MMAEPAGRRWLYNHLAALHIYTTSFASNAMVMAHNEGERSAGLRLVADMTDANPDMYFQMLREIANERRPVDSSRGDPDTDRDDSDSDPFA
jgi:hypothetical protein